MNPDEQWLAVWQQEENCHDNKTTSTLTLQTDRLTGVQVSALLSLQSSLCWYDLLNSILRCFKLKLNTIMRQPSHSSVFPSQGFLSKQVFMLIEIAF